MNRITKIFLGSVLGLLLFVVLGALTFPWWAPTVFQWGATSALRGVGFSETRLSLQRLGLYQLDLDLERLRYAGITLFNTDLTLDYDFSGLRRGELRAAALSHPELVVDLSEAWPGGGEPAVADERPWSDRLPERSPIEMINITNAVIRLQDTDWSRQLFLDAQLTGRELLNGKLSLTGEGLQAEAQIEVQWPDLSGDVDVSATLRNPSESLQYLDIKANHGPVGHQELNLSFEMTEASLQASGAGLESERLTLSVEGILPNALSAVFGVTDGHVTWADGGGRLSGLEGKVTLRSLMPPASEGGQTLQFASIEQGDFTAGSGTLRLDYAVDRTEGPPLDIELTTTALGGDIRIVIQGQVSDPLSLSIRVFLDSVQLEQVAALFPQFEGRIEGVASGELALRFDSKQFALLPGELKLKEDTTGRVKYLRRGWLTQDPDLDPEQFVSGRDIVDIMEDPQGATALTELAMRNLGMSAFSLKIEETASGKQSVVARIEGEREIRGVTVPVVLDIPIRGDVRETINAVFEFNARM